MNIRKNFLKLFQFKEIKSKWHEQSLFKLAYKSQNAKQLENIQVYLGLTNDPLIFLNDLKLNETDINPDLLIFASRHRSEAARPAFLIHTTGNWTNKAEFGGNPRELCFASALLLKAGFLSLLEQEKSLNLSEFSLDIEVTHHGPTTLEKPLVFMELGSSEEEWSINEAGEMVAKSIINTIFKYLQFQTKKSQRVCIGFGGTHYGPQFKKSLINKDVAFSFICPKYFIQELDHKMIEQMIDKNLEEIDCFVIDWKGTNSADKNHLIPLLEDFDIPIKKTKDL
ncbi:MAG: D-aminoacyl-tRNA deacylase [Promethearchaeota archaeon]